jgi:hypothetical protein
MAQELEQVPAATIDARLTQLESQVAALKQQVEGNANQGWLERVIGSTKDMPDFDDVVRYGREARQAQLPPDDVPA